MSGDDDDDEIESSALGTQAFWEKRYDQELRNFDENGDEGEVWFGLSAEKRICDWMKENVPKSANVVDFGCGNGSLLRRLHDLGFEHLLGIDYSQTGVELARKTTAHKGIDSIEFQVCDLLADDASAALPPHSFDVVCDKGTLDAISLGDNRTAAVEAYRRTLLASLKPGDGGGGPSFFVIVSCNFSCSELRAMIESTTTTTSSQDGLAFFLELPNPPARFSFGGKQGSTSTGVVFRRAE